MLCWSVREKVVCEPRVQGGCISFSMVPYLCFRLSSSSHRETEVCLGPAVSALDTKLAM